MPDPTLHGNGLSCPACELRRQEDLKTSALGSPHIPCNMCGGTGRIPKSTEQIVAEHVAWAREHYWRHKGYV